MVSLTPAIYKQYFFTVPMSVFPGRFRFAIRSRKSVEAISQQLPLFETFFQIYAAPLSKLYPENCSDRKAYC